MTVILAAIDKLCRLLSSLFVVAMMSVVSLQVFARFCLPSCPSWTEELARIFYIHIIGFAGPIALRNDLLVNVDIVLNSCRAGLVWRPAFSTGSWCSPSASSSPTRPTGS